MVRVGRMDPPDLVLRHVPGRTTLCASWTGRSLIRGLRMSCLGVTFEAGGIIGLQNRAPVFVRIVAGDARDSCIAATTPAEASFQPIGLQSDG